MGKGFFVQNIIPSTSRGARLTRLTWCGFIGFRTSTYPSSMRRKNHLGKQAGMSVRLLALMSMTASSFLRPAATKKRLRQTLPQPFRNMITE